MRGKRHRLWEGVKSLLILLLSCSAVYLAGRTLFPQESGGLLSRLPQSSAVPTQATQSALLSQVLRPATLAVTWDEGRYGLLHHQEDQEVYTQLTTLLAEALNGASAPSPTDRPAWNRALSQPGFFCEYLGPIPLDALARWLSGQDNASLAGVQALRLCVNAQTLFFTDGADHYYTAPLSADLSAALEELTGELSPNGARFAGSVSGFRLLHPDSLILSLTPELPELAVSAPVVLSDLSEPSPELVQMLQALSFHPQTNPLYAVSGGYAITDGSETLRIASNGQMTYRRSQDTDPRFPVGDSYLDATRTLAEESLGSLCGSARLYLHSVSSASRVTTVTYGYAYRGAAIRVDGSDWCAQFTIEDGAVSAFTLRPRRYTALQEDRAVLLPQEQATAGLSGLRGRTLSLLYEDDRQTSPLTPFWAVRVNGR